MKGRFFWVFGLFLIIHSTAFTAIPISEKNFQASGQYYIILYVETADKLAIDAFITEMESYTDKVIDADYNYTTHEFTIVFTDLLRNDTIYQILLTYFEDFNEVEGNYPGHK